MGSHAVTGDHSLDVSRLQNIYHYKLQLSVSPYSTLLLEHSSSIVSSESGVFRRP